MSNEDSLFAYFSGDYQIQHEKTSKPKKPRNRKSSKKSNKITVSDGQLSFSDIDNETIESQETDKALDENVSDISESSEDTQEVLIEHTVNSDEIPSNNDETSSNNDEILPDNNDSSAIDCGEDKNDNDSLVIDIPRKVPDTLLGIAISNQGKFYVEQSNKLKQAIKHPYIRKDNILTEAERKLYHLIYKELNAKLSCIDKSVVVFPKVRLADIVDVDSSLKNKKEYVYKITSKHIDYLICDSVYTDIICAVELDDHYHYRDDRIARDVFVDDLFRDCSIQLFRIDIPIKRIRPEDIGHVLDYVLEYFTPVCKECGGLMSYKKSTRSYNYGHRFYGCNNWIPGGDGCNFTIDID